MIVSPRPRRRGREGEGERERGKTPLFPRTTAPPRPAAVVRARAHKALDGWVATGLRPVTPAITSDHLLRVLHAPVYAHTTRGTHGHTPRTHANASPIRGDRRNGPE